MVSGLRTRPRSFVGREDELSVLERLIVSAELSTVYVHGIAGIGKTALVGALVERLEASEVDVVTLDCMTIEPTRRGLLGALAYERFESGDGRGDGRVRLVVLDHYEVFRLMDTWLRQVFVPSLPANGPLLLAGREPPVAGWFSVAPKAVTLIALVRLFDAMEPMLPKVNWRGMVAALAGKLSGAATTTIAIRNAVADSKQRITATVDADGNRSAITTDLT